MQAKAESQRWQEFLLLLLLYAMKKNEKTRTRMQRKPRISCFPPRFLSAYAKVSHIHTNESSVKLFLSLDFSQAHVLSILPIRNPALTPLFLLQKQELQHASKDNNKMVKQNKKKKESKAKAAQLLTARNASLCFSLHI